MEKAIFQYSLPDAPYAIEDCQVSQIDISDGRIVFYFPDGVLSAVEGRTSAAKLILICDQDDVLCRVYSPYRCMKKRWYTVRFPDFEEIMEKVNQCHFKISVTAFWLSYKQALLRGDFQNKKLELTLGSISAAYITLE